MFGNASGIDAFWRGLLENFSASTPLVVDRENKPEAAGDESSAEHRIQISDDSAAALHAFVRMHELNPISMVQAAWACLLHRYSGENDIVFGSPTYPAVEGTSGNDTCAKSDILPLRTHVSADESALDLVQRLQDHQASLSEYGNVSLSKISEWCQVSSEKFQFNSVVILSPDTEEISVTRALHAGCSDRHQSIPTYPLNLIVSWNNELTVRIQYDLCRFDRGTIVRMLGHFRNLLEGVVNNPKCPIAQLPLLTEAERHQLVVDWNDTKRTYDGPKCLHHLFEAQVDLTPDAPAVVFTDQVVSYADLDKNANQLAHYLRELGVGRDVVVGVYMERSVEMVTAIYAITKAGGAYVPLDPDYPLDRILYMIEDSRCRLILTQENLSDALNDCTAERVCLDGDRTQLEQRSTQRPVTGSLPDDIAYVIYTSGSTGRPKGVINEHRGICNRLLWMQETYQLTASDRVLQKTPFSFDVSVWELFWPLLSGATLVIAKPGGHRDPAYLIHAINTQRITTLHFVPPMLQAFLDFPDAVHCHSLKRVICSGEALPYELQKRFFQLMSAELHNLYGPTEAAVDVTFWQCRRDTEDRVVPIGRPVANTAIYILDKHLNPVPVGVAGELHIGGIQVARGYLNRPELTAEKFIDDSVGNSPGGRLYKTGDLARYSPNGVIEYLGRIDHQVKIRGFRIELGEIEATIAEHPGVSQSVVALREDTTGTKRLMGYLVPDPDYRPGGAEPNGRVEQVQTIFDETYSQEPATQDAEFDFVGWNSSYSGKLIPEREMREWLDNAISKILSLRPDRVLEIGCGSGMLLFKIAPQCSEYWGTDLSQVALRQLSEKAKQSDTKLAAVKLLHRGANHVDGLPTNKFDTVVINSVVQYFPNIEYLRDVIDNAASLVKSGGRIFIGDVRSLSLLKVFHASVELHKAAPATPTAQLRQRARTSVALEDELVVDPAFFLAIGRNIPRISDVEIHLKRGTYHNEMTRFRFDVVLHLDQETVMNDDQQSVDWQSGGVDIAALRSYLVENAPRLLKIKNIPNARLTTEMKALDLIESSSAQTVDDLRVQLRDLPHAPAADPEDLWAIGDDLPYDIDISWSPSGDPGRFDVLLRHKTTGPDRITGRFLKEQEAIEQWSAYANSPAAGMRARLLIPEVNSYLRKKLPDHMLPAGLMPLESLPLNANGKVERRALPVPEFTRPELGDNFVSPRNDVERKLASIWTEVLGLDQIGIHDNFFDVGGDSIINLQIITRANAIGLKITPAQLFQHNTIAELAEVAGTGPSIEVEQGLVSGAQPLTAMQHWALEHSPLDPHYTNQVALLEAREQIDPDLAERVVQRLIEHHDSLRLRFAIHNADWNAAYAEQNSVAPFELIDLSTVPKHERQSAIEAAAARIHASLDLASGPLLRITAFDFGACEPGRLLLSVNELVTDGVSTRILLEDFETAYQQLRKGLSISLPAKTSSFKHCAEQIHRYAQSDQLQQELGYWIDDRRSNVAKIPIDFPGGTNSEESSERVSTVLDLESTRSLLQDVPRAYRTRMNESLLAGMVQVLTRWMGADSVLLDTEGHGREAIFDTVDFSRTVGVFSAMYPVLLEVPSNSSVAEILKSTKEQVRQIPSRGVGYGLLRYVAEDKVTAQKLEAFPEAQILFNYLGQFDYASGESSLLAPAFESAGLKRSPRELRPHVLDVTLSVVSGQLRVVWTFSRNLHRKETIQQLADDYVVALQAIITHCRSVESAGFTPSDFPLANLDQNRLNAILAADRNITDIYPLSPLQEGMLFHSQFAPDSGAYYVQLSAQLPGDLDCRAFADAWQHVANRHAILRTRFVWKGLDSPLQVVHAKVHVPVEILDWSELAAEEQQRRLQDYAKDRQRGYDVSVAPLMCIYLIRLSDSTYRFIWNFHHLLLDGWSMTAIIEQVFAQYAAVRNGSAVPPESVHQFGDYIEWAAKQDLDQVEDYWKKLLKGFTRPNVLWRDIDPGGLAGETDDFGKHQLTISEQQTSVLKTVAKKHRLTMNTVLHGAWALLLRLWGNRPDVVFGSVVFGRPTDLPHAHATMGLFMNTLPVRINAASTQPWPVWMQDIQSMLIELRDYEHSPLTKVQQWSDVARGVPLFESVIAVQGYLREDSSLDSWAHGLGLRDLDFIDWNSMPLSLAVEVGDELALLFKFDLNRFEKTAVDQILADFRLIVTQMIQKPDVSIDSLERTVRELREADRSRGRKEQKRANIGKLRTIKRKVIEDVKE